MAAVSQADSKRKYSWWWDSHISPKNSIWLQENLTDMDVKVKQMIKLIEEDADSFARRAEMYYKKRPELMKLVEEFYRAYRALAERYDHATGLLRQAHRTMAEAFPNQVPFVMVDDSPASSATDGDPRTPDMPPIRPLFDLDELPKDALGISPSHAVIKRNGAFTEESDSVTGRKGLKQFNDLFGSVEGVNHLKLAEGRARKGLNFHDAMEREQGVQDSGSYDIKVRVPSESERVSKAELEILTLKHALAKLEAEKEAGLVQYQQSLERLSNLESEVFRAKEGSCGLNERACKAEAEVQTLKEALAKLETEREASFLQYQQCLDNISSLENKVSCAQKDAGEQNERASKAEIEAGSLRQYMATLEAEKEAAFVQYKQCFEKMSDLEVKLLHAEEDCRKLNEHANDAEREVETLKQALTKLTEEKEAAAAQYQQCLETIASLEHKLALAQEEAQRLKCDIDDGVVKLKGAEEKCLLLEKSNHTMHSEVESLAQKVADQNEELTEKHKELGRLWTCVQEERLRFMEAETAFQTLQHLHSQSQEELRSMAAELQNRAQILEGLDARNKSLQDEVEQVKMENKSLSEVNLSSALTIQNLQDEISSLRETIAKLEADVELRVDQRNALQQEIYCLKEELNDLTKKHHAIMGEVESVGFSPECLRSSVKDLQNENINLKEVCEKDKSEKAALLEKLEIMEKLIEKNALLENSLSDLNVELEGVRDKVKALEESCELLWREKSTLVSEKAALASELQIAANKLDKLNEENKFFETSLLDANAELEGLRVKSKSLEDLCLLLEHEKSDLATVKGSLISQLNITQKRLEDLEKNYTELEEQYLSLQKERESTLHEVEELRVCLDAEKQEHASLAQLSEAQVASMVSQICLLQEEGQCRKKEYEEELDKAMSAQIEIFILQKCTQDLEENNFSLWLDYQKLLNASKLSEKLISELKHENLEQQVEVKCLFGQIKILRAGLYEVLKSLELDTNLCEDKAEQDQILLNHVLNKLQETQDFLLKMQDENMQLAVENSVLVSLLGQLQLEVANLMTAKTALDQELTTRSEQFLVLQGESQKIVELNEALKMKIMEGDHKEEVLKLELKNLHGQLSDLQGTYQNLQQENCNMLDEQRLFVKSISDLAKEKCKLEEENCAIFAETVSQSTISLILSNILGDKSVEIKDLRENLDKLHHKNNYLKEEVKISEGKLNKLSAIEDEKTKLHKMLEDLKCRYDEVEVIREDQENQITNLSGDYNQQRKEMECICDTNQKLEFELRKLHGEFLEGKSREESLGHELLEGRDEIKLWESQASVWFGKLQISAVQEVFFEGKVHELSKMCESLEHRNCLNAKEIDQLKETVSALEAGNAELKAQMTAYVPAFFSLRDCVTSLENHTFSGSTLHEVDKKEAEDATVAMHTESCQQTSEERSAMVSGGFLDLQELQIRIRAVEKSVMEKERLAMLENLSANSKLEAALRQMEELKSASSLHEAGVETGKNANPKLEDMEMGAAPVNAFRLQKRTHEISGGNEIMTKDIMLDQISECSSYGISRRETVEADDQMLEIWETAKQDGSIDLTVGKAQKVTTSPTEKKHNREHPSTDSFVVKEKELGVDKLEISKRFAGSRQEGNEKKILERLDSDEQKLTNLQITVQDLKRTVEITEKSKKEKVIEYDSVKEQLEESEEAIRKLFDLNRKLMKNVEDNLLSFDEKSALEQEGSGSIRRMKISEQAKRGSEKIGRLQLEVQKLQFLLLKLDDENKSRGKTKITERKTRVLLRDYLYGGTRISQKRKKGHFCSCMQPPTMGD